MRPGAWGVAIVVAGMLGSGCGLPPPYEPNGTERFWSLMALEKWTKDQAKPGATERSWKTNAMTALVTWRIGKDAPLPRMWRVDSCVVHEGTWADTPYSPPSHGTVTLSGATDKDVTLSMNRDSWGYPDLVGDEAWPEGRTMTVSATGGRLPGFSATTTVRPAAKLLTYDLEALRPEELHISRAQPLSVTWTPQADQVLMVFMQFDPVSHEFFHGIWCRFPGSAGAGTVPAEALATLVEKSKTYLTNMYFGTVDFQSVTSGQDDLELYQWNGRALRIYPD